MPELRAYGGSVTRTIGDGEVDVRSYRAGQEHARAEERSLMECGHSKANLVTMVSEKDARATASFCSVCAEVAKAKEDAARDEREACVALVPKVCPACSTNDFGDHVKDAERIGEDEWAAVECECSAIAGAIRARSGGDSDAA